MQWRIAGADQKTGKDVTLVIDAPSEVEALKLAKDRGVFVSNAKEIGKVRALEYAGRASDTKNPTLDFDADGIPTYALISAGAKTLGHVGKICVVAGVVGIFAGLIMLVDAFKFENASGSAAISTIVSGVALAAAGPILKMIGQVALAVRDMARNSFKG